MNTNEIWTIEVLTPLHIGSGQRLREGFDFVEHDGALWVVDQGAMLRALLEAAEADASEQDLVMIAANLSGRKLDELQQAGLLEETYFDLEKRVFRYCLPGKSSSVGKQGELVEEIKDVFGRPYLPGSSLKGGLRSIVLRALASKDTQKPAIQYSTKRTRGEQVTQADAGKTAQVIEERHFIRAEKLGPYYELWRALRISDSQPLDRQPLALGHLLVFPIRDRNRTLQAGLPVDIEAIPAGATCQVRVSVDDWLFENPDARQQLKFLRRDKQLLTGDLRDMVNWDTRSRLNEDYHFFARLGKEVQGDMQSVVKQAGGSYAALAEQFKGLQEHEMILQIGKGSGWLGKTLGRVLREKLSPAEFEQWAKEFNLGKGSWKSNQEIPRTRQLCSIGGQRYAPLGWIKVKVEMAL